MSWPLPPSTVAPLLRRAGSGVCQGMLTLRCVEVLACVQISSQVHAGSSFAPRGLLILSDDVLSEPCDGNPVQALGGLESNRGASGAACA